MSQDNLEKKVFNWAYSFKGLQSMAAETGESLSLRLGWSTLGVSEQPKLQRETLSGKKNPKIQYNILLVYVLFFSILYKHFTRSMNHFSNKSY